MKQCSISKASQQEDSANKIKGAYVFENQDTDNTTKPNVRPAVMVTDLESVEVTDEPIADSVHLPLPEELTTKKRGRKWVVLLFVTILLASSAEFALFVIAMVEQMDWLAGVWLAIFSVLGIACVRLIYNEYRGLKQLKRQEMVRAQSQQMASTSVIGLAEQHCLKIADGLPKDYQNLVVSWRDNIDSHHSDSEVLALFEHQVLAPIDKLALKQVSNNASAASVMIAVSPFALLDMLIVLWRNTRMINQVSNIYGLHLGYWGRISLIRNIFHTMLYAGAAEILSEAGNYALSAGVTGKISTRIAQGMGAGVLTARIGLKAMNESRPLPWLKENKPGLSGISKQLLADLNTRIR